MSNLLGPVRQLGFVVDDIEAAMRHWTHSLHVGPFYYRAHARILGNEYRGESAGLQISFALAYSGNLQIALLQQRDDSRSVFRDFLQGRRAGLHHLGFFTEQFERDLQRADEAGLVVAQRSTVDAGAGHVAMLDADSQSGPRAALIALHAGNIGIFDMVRREALRWDGSGPIRTLED